MTTKHTVEISVRYSQSGACPDCHGLMAYDGSYTRRLPIGFGFAGSDRFQVDCIEEKGFAGECMECGRRVLAWQKRRHVTKYPRGINAAIAKAKGAQ